MTEVGEATCATPANLTGRTISMLPENLFICECDASSMLNLSTIYCVKYAHTLESMDAPIVCGGNKAKIPPDIAQQLLYQQTWQATLLEAAPLALCLHVALIKSCRNRPHVMLSSVLSITCG